MTRRAFLRGLGRSSFAVAILGVGASCSGGDGADAPTGSTAATTPSTTATPATTTPDASTTTTTSAAEGLDALRWARVPLGFVSAYVLVRGSEAAVVDTGTSGSTDAVGETLAAFDLGWDAVGHVVLTHRHDDHIGSLAEMSELAPGATAYAGWADLDAIGTDVPLVGVGDGDTVFGLEIVDTPGHTPGHIAVLDPAGSLLVAGDAVTTDGGVLAGPVARFTADPDEAVRSVAKLAGRDFDTVVVGHGDPYVGDADVAMAELAVELGA